MMFNGLLVYGDSDTSDFAVESVGAGSVAGSAGSAGSGPAERSRRLEAKLMATLQVLKNKEETVRVQAESLALAEARIAALAARPPPPPAPRAHRADQTEPLSCTRSSADGCCADTSDVTSQTQEVDGGAVRTLQDHLGVIEDLYRECFYEAAKQEEVIDLLRQSCLELRRSERAGPARQWSLQGSQNIALEVENLKTEIADFLNSSNHDSGMWERPEEPVAAEVADELQHISRQLLQLRDLLKDGCTCGLEDENLTLKRINETLEVQVEELRQRVSGLEATGDESAALQRQELMEAKDREVSSLRQQLDALEAESREQRASCSDLKLQLQQLQTLLQARAEELARAQACCEERGAAVARLQRELARAQGAADQSGRMRAEVAQLSAQVGGWREQLADGRRRLRALHDELRRERARAQHLKRHCQEKEGLALELQEQLEEARARGAALCEEAQRAVCAVRHWLRRQRARHREQEQRIQEQDKLIRTLQRRELSDLSPSSSEPCCSRQFRRRPSEGASERSTSVSAPTPPRRRTECDDRECQWPGRREAASQRPPRADARTATSRDSLRDPPALNLLDHMRLPQRERSPTDALLERVECVHGALAEARRRWRRSAPRHDS